MVVQQWQMGRSQRDVARMVSLDRTTVGRYLAAAKAVGVSQDGEESTRSSGGCWSASWELGVRVGVAPAGRSLEDQRAFLSKKLEADPRLTKIWRLLRRGGTLAKLVSAAALSARSSLTRRFRIRRLTLLCSAGA